MSNKAFLYIPAMFRSSLVLGNIRLTQMFHCGPCFLSRRQFTAKPRANGRNIVGQQLPTLLDVTCCVRLHTLLHVVGCCCAKFETDQTFQSTTSNSLLLPDRRDVAQQCWIRWHSSSNTWFTKAYGLFFPTMYCRSQHCWELLHPLAHHCQHGRNDFQHCWRNSVGSCFRLRLTLLQNFRK